MLNLNVIKNWGMKPFKSLDVWLTDPRFKQLITQEWKNNIGMPAPHKLKLLKIPIKKWNKECFGNVDENIRRIENESKKIDIMGDGRDLNDEETSRFEALNEVL